MSILVIASLYDPGKADAFLHFVEGAAAVLGPRGSVEITSLGAFDREGRGKTETVCGVVVKPKSPRSAADPTAMARDFEAVLRSMVAASDLQGCDARAYAREDD